MIGQASRAKAILGFSAFPGSVLMFLVLTSLVVPHLLSYTPYEADFRHVLETPGPHHWMGTDELGRDILSRLLQGVRLSLFFATGVQLAGMTVGVAVGLIAGFFGGAVDAALMSLVDSLYAFPSLVIVIVFIALLPSGIFSIMVALALVSWPLVARAVRSKVVTLRNEQFVLAAQVSGAGTARVLLRHILPNSMSPVITLFVQGAAVAVMGEAALSYLGIGVPASYPSLGRMIATGREYLGSAPHLAFFPTVGLVLIIVCLNRLGEALRVHVDPRLKTRI